VPFPATGFFARLRAPKPAPIDLLPYLEPKEGTVERPVPAGQPAPAAPPPPAAPAPPPAKDDWALPPERPLVPNLGGGPVEGTVLNLAAPGRGMQSASASPLRGLQVGLLGTSGKFAGKSFRISKTPTLVGRTTGDLVLHDDQISGRHAQLDVLGLDHASLKDLASTNGTTINGRPISTASIKHGDLIGFGGVEFRFVLRPEPRGGA